MTKSCGNVFEDLGLDNPAERLVKADLALLIQSRMDAQQLTQAEAARLMGTHQPTVSNIRRGLLDDYSIERLLGYARKLDSSVRLQVVSADKPEMVRVGKPGKAVSVKGAVGRRAEKKAAVRSPRNAVSREKPAVP